MFNRAARLWTFGIGIVWIIRWRLAGSIVAGNRFFWSGEREKSAPVALSKTTFYKVWLGPFVEISNMRPTKR
jgi:hypothetical protein